MNEITRSVRAAHRVAESQSGVMRSQDENKQEMTLKSYTHEDMRVLIEEFLVNGGKITQCPPGVAYDLRSDDVDHFRKRVVSKRTIAPTRRAVLYKKSA